MLLSLSVLLLVAIPSVATAQDSAEQLMDRIELAVRDADVDGIISAAAGRIDVSIFGEGKNYSRAQAEFVLSEFFGSHNPTSFRFTATSKTTNGRFAEGLFYSAESRRPFRVYVRLQRRSGNWEVREFVVEQRRR